MFFVEQLFFYSKFQQAQSENRACNVSLITFAMVGGLTKNKKKTKNNKEKKT